MTIYSPEITEEICKRIATGESLVSICRDKQIAYNTVLNWLKDDSKIDFLRNYTRAREDQADYYAEQVIEIADDTDLLPDDRRIKIDARKWRAGGLKPKKYAEKRMLAGDEENPVSVKHSGSLDIGAELIAQQIERIINK